MTAFIGRREFMTLLGGAAAVWPLAAYAQQPAIPVIGFLSGVSLKTFGPMVAAFHRGLKETGYVEGQNVTIEYRWAEGQYNQLPSLAADLVGRPVAVIAATGGPASGLAAKAATPSIPIVFLSGSDPVNAGLVGNLARPEGNATGVTFFADTLMAKRFELMRELVPNAPAIAVLINPMNVDAPGQLREVQAAARAARQELFVLNASTPSEIDAAFAVLVKQAVGALIVAGDPMFVSRREQIGSLGDIGYIDDVDPNAGEIATSFDGRSVTYVFGELDMLVPAYATTIHKSQGSEYPAVIIPMLTQHYAMLQRNLLCTGVTRGKRLVVLVGQKKAVAIAVRNVSGRRRWSKLSEWLRPRPPIACHVGTAG